MNVGKLTFSSFILQPTEKPLKHLADGIIIMGIKLLLHLFSNIFPLATPGKLATLKMFRLFMLKIAFFSTGAAARSLTCELLFSKW